MISMPPAVILLVGALFVPFIKGKAKNWFVILLPVLAFYLITQLEAGSSWHVHFFGFDLTFLRVDKLSKIFGYIFTINAFAAFIYAFYLKDNTQHVAALLYIGSALGVVFSGDLIALYFFWEIMAVASTFLILTRKTKKSLGAGYRYILVHVFGGLCFLAGIVFYINSTGSIEFTAMTDRNIATYLILIGMLVNAAAPPLSAWLPDAYPEATVTGGVILSAYTTKTAVYTLIRGFPGWEVLIVIGCIMTLYGIIYALMENDMRRILAYSIINQVGFMITGVGIGTAMSLNGAAAHAFAHIIYKALLWMSAGSVLYMTGKSKCTDLGGLYKTMPLTLIFGGIGALAISAFPLTSGFTSKSLIIDGSMHQHLFWVWLILEIASAGVFLHAGIKFPYFVFFAKDKGLRPGETNKSMLIAMGFMSFLCIFLGVYPKPLYDILPYPMEHFSAYSASHVVSQLQLLMLSALVFFLFLKLLKRTETISIDTDWFYRKGGKIFYRVMDVSLNSINAITDKIFIKQLTGALISFAKDGPANLFMMVAYPFWLISGRKADQIALKKAKIYKNVKISAMPVGIVAVPVILYLTLLFLFG
ncbi:MAG TPA: Na(+)/H(+) antiporter subunit D [Bacteroidetes bacterium]|nr:Na(+)/H(+) antiporter subunit D [Bacteroidota bacterium]